MYILDACFYFVRVLKYIFLLYSNCFIQTYSCRYYIEVLCQDYGYIASVDVGFYKEKSTFTAQQTVDAVNEIQVINASYDVLDEIQVGHSISMVMVF